MYKYTEWEDIKKSGLAEEYLIFDKQFETMNIIRSLQKKNINDGYDFSRACDVIQDNKDKRWAIVFKENNEVLLGIKHKEKKIIDGMFSNISRNYGR